jgi:Flp pilus assembly protein TadD
VLLGTAQLSKQQPAAALATFKKMQSIAPKDPRAVHLTGIALQAAGHKAEAAREFERALTMKSSFVDPLTALVGQAIGEGQTGAALERIKKQINTAGNSARLQFLLASTHQLRKENAQAEAAYTKALELDNTFVPAYVALGQMHVAAQDNDKALARFEEALKVNPNDVISRMMVAQIHLNRGDQAKAIAAYEHILAAKPRFVPAANNLAWLMVQSGDKERALQLATIAKEGAPDDPFVSDTLGWILHQRGVHERAWTLIKESAAKQPGNPEIQYHAGVLAQKMGQPELAKAHFQRVVSSSSNYTNKAEKALTELK